MISRGLFARQLKVGGCYGAVEVEIDLHSFVTSISVQTHGDGFRSQGYIEEVPAQGYEDWKQGAVLGVAFALWTAKQRECGVVITKIEGLTSDTNPTIIAAAAMDAIWKAIEYTPESTLTSQILQNILMSWELPNNSICIPW